MLPTAAAVRTSSHGNTAAEWVDVTTLWREECAADSGQTDALTDVVEVVAQPHSSSSHAKYTAAELLALKPDGAACEPPHDANMALIKCIASDRNDAIVQGSSSTLTETANVPRGSIHTTPSDVARSRDDVSTATAVASAAITPPAASTAPAATSNTLSLDDGLSQRPCAADAVAGVTNNVTAGTTVVVPVDTTVRVAASALDW